MGARTSFLCGLALVAALFAGALPTEAQQRTCFAQTGHCIGGRFVEFWQQNGGLPVFGYPLTDVRIMCNRLPVCNAPWYADKREKQEDQK